MNHVRSEELQSFHDGQLNVERERAIAEHLSICEPCRSISEDYAKIRSWVLEAGDYRTNPMFAAHVESFAATDRQHESQWLGIEQLAARTVLAMSAVVAILMLLSLFEAPPAVASVDRMLTSDRLDSTAVQFMSDHEISRDEALIAAVARQ